MNAIETEKLTRRFWRHEALTDVDLYIPTGSVTALLGPNGAGKSTTIKIIMNLLRATSGTARVLGVDSRKLGPPQLAQIGYVSENQQLPLWMTVRQFLDFCRPLYKTWDVALERQLLADFDLPPERKLGKLSRGMLMKAALLSSLAYRPKLLVLDEPFSGLDPLVREELGRGIIEATAVNEWTILISSHDIEEVERIADRIILLDAGRVAVQEPVEPLQARFRRIEITGVGRAAVRPAGVLQWEQSEDFLTFVDPTYSGASSEAAWRERFSASGVSVQPLTLREIFISLTRAKIAARREQAA